MSLTQHFIETIKIRYMKHIHRTRSHSSNCLILNTLITRLMCGCIMIGSWDISNNSLFISCMVTRHAMTAELTTTCRRDGWMLYSGNKAAHYYYYDRKSNQASELRALQHDNRSACASVSATTCTRLIMRKDNVQLNDVQKFNTDSLAGISISLTVDVALPYPESSFLPLSSGDRSAHTSVKPSSGNIIDYSQYYQLLLLSIHEKITWKINWDRIIEVKD